MRLLSPALVMPQPCEARGSAQLPGKGTLTTRPVESSQKLIVGCRRGIRCALQQNQLSFDPQQLGYVPACIGAVGSRESFVDRDQSLGHLPCTAQGSCECAEECHVVPGERGLAKFVKRCAEELQSGGGVAGLV